MTPNSRKRGGTDKSRKRRRQSIHDYGCTLTLPSTSKAAVPCLASSSHECGTECITRGEYKKNKPGAAVDGRITMGRAHAIRRGRSCCFLVLLILAGAMSNGECDDSSSTNGPTLLRRRRSLSVPDPLGTIATIDQGDTTTITRPYSGYTGRILYVPCETAECKKKRRQRKKKKAQQNKKREANQKRRQRRKKRNEKKQQVTDGTEELSKGLVSPTNDSSLPLVEIDDNATSVISDDTGANITLPGDAGEGAINWTTPPVPNAAEESTKSTPHSGISAKPQYRCKASIDDTITEDHCAQYDCLYDEETGLWNDDNCPDDQVCVYAKLCEAKLPTFPGGMPEGLQLAPAGGGGGGPGPGPSAASTSSGTVDRSSSLLMESTVAANHLRRPHTVSLDLEDG